MQSGGHRHHDEESNDVGCSHAQIRVPLDALNLHRRLLRGFFEGRLIVIVLHFLNLGTGLPEKQVGADGGAKKSDEHDQEFPVGGEVGNEGSAQRGAPVDVHGEDRGDISEQRQRQPLEDVGIAHVGHADLKDHGQQCEEGSIHMGGPADDELHSGPHGVDVRGQIDRVCDEQQQDHRIRHPLRVVLAHVARDAPASDPADEGADLLNRRHEGVNQHHRPQQAVTKLRTRLGVGGDATGVII